MQKTPATVHQSSAAQQQQSQNIQANNIAETQSVTSEQGSNAGNQEQAETMIKGGVDGEVDDYEGELRRRGTWSEGHWGRQPTAIQNSNTFTYNNQQYLQSTNEATPNQTLPEPRLLSQTTNYFPKQYHKYQNYNYYSTTHNGSHHHNNGYGNNGYTYNNNGFGNRKFRSKGYYGGGQEGFYWKQLQQEYYRVRNCNNQIRAQIQGLRGVVSALNSLPHPPTTKPLLLPSLLPSLPTHLKSQLEPLLETSQSLSQTYTQIHQQYQQTLSSYQKVSEQLSFQTQYTQLQKSNKEIIKNIEIKQKQLESITKIRESVAKNVEKLGVRLEQELRGLANRELLENQTKANLETRILEWGDRKFKIGVRVCKQKRINTDTREQISSKDTQIQQLIQQDEHLRLQLLQILQQLQQPQHPSNQVLQKLCLEYKKLSKEIEQQQQKKLTNVPKNVIENVEKDIVHVQQNIEKYQKQIQKRGEVLGKIRDVREKMMEIGDQGEEGKMGKVRNQVTDKEALLEQIIAQKTSIQKNISQAKQRQNSLAEQIKQMNILKQQLSIQLYQKQQLRNHRIHPTHHNHNHNPSPHLCQPQQLPTQQEAPRQPPAALSQISQKSIPPHPQKVMKKASKQHQNLQNGQFYVDKKLNKVSFFMTAAFLFLLVVATVFYDKVKKHWGYR